MKDNRTRLIWEQEPDRSHDVWGASVARCLNDPPSPAGHPFSTIKSGNYYTAIPDPKDDIVAWQVSFFSGEPVTDQKSGTRRLRCVLWEPRK